MVRISCIIRLKSLLPVARNHRCGPVLSSGVSIFKLGAGKILKRLKMSRTTSSLCLWSVSVVQVLVVAVIACLGPLGRVWIQAGPLFGVNSCSAPSRGCRISPRVIWSHKTQFKETPFCGQFRYVCSDVDFFFFFFQGAGLELFSSSLETWKQQHLLP